MTVFGVNPIDNSRELQQKGQYDKNSIQQRIMELSNSTTSVFCIQLTFKLKNKFLILTIINNYYY